MTSSRALIALVLLLIALGTPAQAWDRGSVETFATLPAGTQHPEGITADRHGNIYVTTFDVSKAAGPGDLLVFGPNGRLLRHLQVAGSSNLLLDLAFHPHTGTLLVLDFGNPRVLAVDPQTGASSVFATIPGGAAAGPNVLTFDHAGNVYVSDSFQGTIWKTGPAGGAMTAWVSDPLLTTTGVPPFGANGLAFNNAGDALFVCNTGNDSVLRIAVAGGNASAPTAFAYSVNGCDGLIIDEDDNLDRGQPGRRDRRAEPGGPRHRQAGRLRGDRPARPADRPAVSGQPRAVRPPHLHQQPVARPAALRIPGRRRPVGGRREAPHHFAHSRADSEGQRPEVSAR
jgi:sugar lactone lactonase YvrE